MSLSAAACVSCVSFRQFKVICPSSPRYIKLNASPFPPGGESDAAGYRLLQRRGRRNIIHRHAICVRAFRTSCTLLTIRTRPVGSSLLLFIEEEGALCLVFCESGRDSASLGSPVTLFQRRLPVCRVILSPSSRHPLAILPRGNDVKMVRGTAPMFHWDQPPPGYRFPPRPLFATTVRPSKKGQTVSAPLETGFRIAAATFSLNVAIVPD